MKTLNTHWKLIAFGTFAVMMTLWAGSRMEAKTGQDYTAQSARVSPQAREAAINIFGPIGLTRGQTLRIGGVWIPGPHVVLTLTFFDCGGRILMSNTYIPGPANTCSSFDLNADQLPPGEFDNTGRTEMNVVLKSDGGIWKPGSFSATAQVFENNTGKSTLLLSLSHPGGMN